MKPKLRERFLADAISAVLAGKEVGEPVEWDQMIRSCLDHVRDIVAGIRRALEFADLPGHGVYTLSAPDTRCPEPTMELLEKFRPDLARTVDPPLKGREPLLSISRAQKAFGYSPKHRLID